MKYLCAEDDRAAFVAQLLNQIYDLENKAEERTKLPRNQSSPRAQSVATSKLKTLAVKDHVVIPEESPTKTSLKLDKASASLRRYGLIKDRHQCPVGHRSGTGPVPVSQKSTFLGVQAGKQI